MLSIKQRRHNQLNARLKWWVYSHLLKTSMLSAALMLSDTLFHRRGLQTWNDASQWVLEYTVYF